MEWGKVLKTMEKLENQAYAEEEVSPEEEEQKLARAEVVRRLQDLPILHENAWLGDDDQRGVINAAMETLHGAGQSDVPGEFCTDSTGAIIDTLVKMHDGLKTLKERLEEARGIVLQQERKKARNNRAVVVD